MSKARRKPKRPKNLLLEPDAVARGERYSRRYGTSLSRLVGDFLRSLPLDADEGKLTPAVRRLWGIATDSGADREQFRQHLTRKYGSG